VGLDEITTQNGKQPPVKIYSLLKNPHGSKINKESFNCSLMRTGVSLAGTSNKQSKKLEESFNHKELISTETSPNLSQLLMPALNLKVENEQALSLLGHEGYQLK